MKTFPEYRIYKARRCDINLACAWISPYTDSQILSYPRIARITRKLDDGKELSCYVQLRTIDQTVGDHDLWDTIKNEKRKIILLSEYYRNILGIENSKFKSGMGINIDIDESECFLKKWYYRFRLTSQHPEASVFISLQLGIISLFLGIISLIIGWFTNK